MTPEQFLAKVAFVKQRKPAWFMAQDPDCATLQAVHDAEQSLGGKLPAPYVLFATRLNAGYFAFINLFSVAPDSDWNIVARNAEFDLPDDIVAFSDDGTGGYHAFRIDNGRCLEQVVYHDTGTGETLDTGQGFFDFVIEHAFQPEYFGLQLP